MENELYVANYNCNFWLLDELGRTNSSPSLPVTSYIFAAVDLEQAERIAKSQERLNLVEDSYEMRVFRAVFRDVIGHTLRCEVSKIEVDGFKVRLEELVME